MVFNGHGSWPLQANYKVRFPPFRSSTNLSISRFPPYNGMKRNDISSHQHIWTVVKFICKLE